MNSLFVPGKAVITTCHWPTTGPPPLEPAPCAAAASSGTVPGRANLAAPARAEGFGPAGALQAARASMALAASMATERNAIERTLDGRIGGIRAFICSSPG